MADIAFDDQVDITDKVCPLTFVKAKVAIEELDDGEVLAIRMNDGEPVQNVPRSMKKDTRYLSSRTTRMEHTLFTSERLRTNHGSKNFKG